MQKKTAALYEEVISEYEADKSSGMKVIRVDATKSIDEVAAFIADCLKK